MNDRPSMSVEEGFDKLFGAILSNEEQLVRNMIEYLVKHHKEATINVLHDEKLYERV